MDRTARAALLAAFIGFALVAGVLLFLELPVVAALSAGAVIGALSGLLIWGAGRRADGFHGTDRIPPVEPGFPGPPEHDDRPVDGGSEAPGEREPGDRGPGDGEPGDEDTT